MADALLPLTALPEWSAFFRSACVADTLHFRWRQGDGGNWTAEVYEFVGRKNGLRENALCTGTGSDPFGALGDALDRSPRPVSAPTREAFSLFRYAATGEPMMIEDLL